MEEKLLSLFAGMFNQEARSQAIEEIERLTTNPEVVPVLTRLICPPHTSYIRQMAFFLIQRKISLHWANLPSDQKENLKICLKERISAEESPPLRRACANAASAVAKHAIPAGEWLDLLPLLSQLSKSPQDQEVAAIVFSSLLGSVDSTLILHFEELNNLLHKFIEHGTSYHVKVVFLRSSRSFQESTNAGEVDDYRRFTMWIFDMSLKFFSCGMDDLGLHTFEIYDEVIESSALLLNELVQLIMSYSHVVGVAAGLAFEALSINRWLIDHKFNVLMGYNLIGEIVLFVCNMIQKSIYTSEYGVEDNVDSNIKHILERITDRNPVYVLSPMLGFASTQLLGIPSTNCPQSTNAKDLQAGIKVLSVLAKTCSVGMKQKLESALEMVIVALQNPDKHVKRDALNAWMEFDHHLQPDVASYYPHVLPPIVNAIGGFVSPHDPLKEKFVGELATLCQKMGEEIRPHLDTVMDIILNEEQYCGWRIRIRCMAALDALANVMSDGKFNSTEKIRTYFHRIVSKTISMWREKSIRNDDNYDEGINRGADAIARMIMVHPNPTQLKKVITRLVKIFADVAISQSASNEIKISIGGAFAYLNSLHGEEMEKSLSELSHAQVDALTMLIPR